MADYLYTMTLQVSGNTGQTTTGFAGETIRAAFEGELSIKTYRISAGWSGKATDGGGLLYPIMGLVISFVQTTSSGNNKAALDAKALSIKNQLQANLPSQAITLINHEINVQL